MIHGMSNDIRNKTGNSNLDMIVGYGAGNPPSYTAEIWRKDLFIYLLTTAGIETWQGAPGGQMSGWTKNNMNQLFRKHYHDPRVQSLQIEIVRELRDDPAVCELTAECLASVMNDAIQYGSWKKNVGMNVGEY